MKNIMPRQVPTREEKYMGLAWFYASFSKDPSTQVGACLVGEENNLLGTGYNGPPRIIDDESFSWCRPPKDDPNAFSKYDVMVHAEVNAIDHASDYLTGATLYSTALPCSDCMLEIVRRELGRVVYFDFASNEGSSLRSIHKHEKTKKIAELAGIKLEKFSGNLNWMSDWNMALRNNGVFE